MLTCIWSNRSYAILRGELAAVGVRHPGQSAIDMLSLDRPAIEWASLARGLELSCGKSESLDEFKRAFEAGLQADGPFLIEVVLCQSKIPEGAGSSSGIMRFAIRNGVRSRHRDGRWPECSCVLDSTRNRVHASPGLTIGRFPSFLKRHFAINPLRERTDHASHRIAGGGHSCLFTDRSRPCL